MITLEEIYQGLASEFQAQTGQTAGGSSELAVRFYAVAAQIYSLYVQAEWTRRQCFPQTAEGEDLDKHAKLRGVTRRQATCATGTVRFYVDEARQMDTEVTKGTVCMTAGGVRFLTTADGMIPAGEAYCEVPVVAAEPGEAGNVGQGTIVYMALPPLGVVACANPEALSNGQDEESDEELRVRVLATFQRLANGANNAFYRQTALSFDGVAAVTVLPRNRGVGTVDVVPAAQGGLPDQALLDTLQEHFDRVREIACDVKVMAPTVETVDVAVKLWAKEDWKFDAVALAVRDRLEDWFNGERLGQPLPRAQLISLIYGVDGVANCQLVKPEADLPLSNITLPLLGALTIDNGGGWRRMTLKFEDYLVNLLRPLGVYDLRTGTINRGELAAYGVELDRSELEQEDTYREMNLTTAEDFGLERIEALLPYRPVCYTVEQRRAALAALLRISGDSFTPEAINDTLKGCGLNARAEETDQPNYVKVYFPDVAGIPEGFDQLRVIIEEILPSHVDITYVFWYNTWAMVADRHPTFGDGLDTGLSWYGLAIENDGYLADIW